MEKAFQAGVGWGRWGVNGCEWLRTGTKASFYQSERMILLQVPLGSGTLEISQYGRA